MIYALWLRISDLLLFRTRINNFMKIKRGFTTLSLSPLFLMSSCLELQVGEVIRCPERQYYSIDASQPHEKIAYRVSNNEYVFQAPVVSSGQGAKLVFFNVFDLGMSSRFYQSDANATGELRWLRAKRSRNSDNFTLQLLSKKPDLSRTSRVDSTKFKFIGNPNFPYPSNPRDFTTTSRAILAAPFDYVIDPIASVPLTLTYYTGALIVSPFAILLSQAPMGERLEAIEAEVIISNKIDSVVMDNKIDDVITPSQ